jgi:hypothetical protein
MLVVTTHKPVDGDPTNQTARTVYFLGNAELARYPQNDPHRLVDGPSDDDPHSEECPLGGEVIGPSDGFIPVGVITAGSSTNCSIG